MSFASFSHSILKFLPLLLVLVGLFTLGSGAVIGHGEEHTDGDEHSEEEHEEEASRENLEEFVRNASLRSIIGALIITFGISLYASFRLSSEKANNKLKIVTFGLIILVVMGATLFAASSTIYLNVISDTKGPVHWHADYEIWNCGQNVELIHSTGMANRVGSPVLHVHNDNKIHVEGVLVKTKFADLHSVVEILGGQSEEGLMRIPTDKGVVSMTNGELCNGQPGQLQGFVYKITNPEDRKNWVYEQIKLDDIGAYVLSAESNSPPGDCIIIEFDQEKESTDKICVGHRLAMERGELRGS